MLLRIEAHKLTLYHQASPIIDSALMQVDWEHAAKDDGEALPRIARELRERTRRAMLLEYAPTSVQNDWSDQPVQRVNARYPTVGLPLAGLHPACARGIVAFVDDAGRAVERRSLLNLYPVLASVRATAALVREEPPIPTGA